MHETAEITPQRRNRRILIVEDEALVAITLADCISELGYDCVGPFFSVEAAVATARAGRIDAAILDVKFGDAVSYELPDILAARGIPFAFATGYLQDGLDPKWSDRPYLSKPYEIDGVREILARVLTDGGGLETHTRKPETRRTSAGK